MIEIHLKAPLDLREEKPKTMSLGIGSRSPVPSDKLADLEKQVKTILEDEIQNTGTMRRRLNALNDMLEGVAQEVNYPFPNASNVDVKMAIGTARTVRSTMVRALFSDLDRAFIASIDDDTRRGDANIVEDAFNWKAAHENGMIDSLKDSIIPIFRDGTAFLQGIWEKKIEKGMDYRSYLTAEDFLVDYPDPESAGIPEEKFTEVLNHLSEPDSYLDVNFDIQLTRKEGAAFSVVTLPRFHWWPLSARNMDECEVYGVRMEESEATMKRKRKSKEYWEAAVDACISANKDGSGTDIWDRSRDFIEGISRTSGGSRRKDFENFRLVLTIDMDDDDIPEKYMGVYNLAAGKFLNFDRYKIRNNIDFLVPMRFDRRDDRLLGRSLAYDGMDLFQEITDIHRHRNNNRLITDATCFKAEDDLKDSIETSLNEWRPGMVVWVPKGRMTGITQFDVSNRSNTQNSMDEENSLRGYVEFVIGPTQGLSGQETKGDANAPATKHLSKIRQAGFRMDDYIDELKRSFPDIGKLAMALYYQYGKREMAYQAKGETGKPEGRTADRALFGIEGLTLDLNARSVIMSPEFEMERIMALVQAAGANPIVLQTKPMILGLLWDRFISASRVQNPEELKVGQQMQMPIMPGMPGTGGAPGIPGVGPAIPPVSVGSGMPPLKSLISSLGINGPTERRVR